MPSSLAKLAVAALLGLGVITPSTSAYAAPTTTRSTSRSAFQQGLRFYAKKQYDQALGAFLQAYEQTKNPEVLVNIGQTSLRLGDPLSALHAFQKYLEDAKKISPDRQNRVEASIAEARAQLGGIDVTAPDGADVSVDGESVGRAPLTSTIDVVPGPHEVTMTSSAGNRSEKVSVAKGGRVALSLAPPRRAAPTPAPVAAPQGEPDEAPGFFAPPEIVAPVYIAGAAGLLSFSAAIVLNGIRVNADRNGATAADALVRAGQNPALCANASKDDPSITGSCATLRDSRRTIRDTDEPYIATLWVGAGATALALTWYFIAPKAKPNATSGAVKPPVRFTPTFGTNVAGGTLQGSF